jgi:hypothetical protein
MTANFHPELRQLRSKLQEIYAVSVHFRPLSLKPSILDSSVIENVESLDDSPWAVQEQIPGLRQLQEYIRLDLDALDKVVEPYLLSRTPIVDQSLFSSSSMTYHQLPCHPSPQMPHT